VAAKHSFLTDTTTGTSFQCQGLRIVGTFKSGNGLTNPIGQITAALDAGGGAVLCGSTTQFALTFGHFPMHIRAMSYNATTGVTTGMITGIHITFSPPGGGAPCTGIIDGTGPAANNGQVHFAYLNTGGELHLTVAGDLHTYNVTGCGGLIHSGDAISYRARTFPLNDRSGLPNTITSP